MPGLVVAGREVTIPGLRVLSWRDDPALRLKMGEDGTARPPGTRIRGVVLHTTRGIPGGSDPRPQVIVPGPGPSTKTAQNTVRWWSGNGTSAGAHLIVDFDGTVYQTCDVVTEQSYHATTVNARTVGIELVQGAKAELYEGELDAARLLVDALTFLLAIQRQVHWPYTGQVPRLAQGGHTFFGVYGHRDQTLNRGQGDPGNAATFHLIAAGYESFDVGRSEDLDAWSDRQRELNAAGFGPLTVDGRPGDQTCAALTKKLGRALWVPRPIDDELQPLQDV